MATKLDLYNSFYPHLITEAPFLSPDVLSNKFAKMNLVNSEPRQVAGESFVETQPPDQPPQPSRRANKRPRYQNLETTSSGQNEEKDGEGDERDGHKYPDTKVPVLSFECPFCKLDPRRYEECRGRRLKRLSDVIQHIKRQHLLEEVGLESERCQPEDIILYCARCRCLFHGMGAERRRRRHLTEEIPCQITNIEQSGVMLPRELQELKSELGLYPRHSESFRWYIIWDRCFPGKARPLSPYVEIILPRPQVQLMIEDELRSVQRLSSAEARSIARRSTERIYTTSSPASEPQRNPSVPPVPPRARPNAAQRALEPTHRVLNYTPPNRASSSQPFRLFRRPQGLENDSDSYNTGVFGTPNASQGDNSFHRNNTFTTNSAPIPISGFGVYTTYEHNIVDSGYSTAPCVGYSTASFESASQDDDYLNPDGDTVGRRGSQY
ncbi:hypothetical protein FOCG_11990 [Fusarium oxysporum f. sp. radicis-lycopersici 26381]|nr:hypothetical protein FOCG_11990 [Fusarium oxysporum f. sp. radicis-lycopersici 26381]